MEYMKTVIDTENITHGQCAGDTADNVKAVISKQRIQCRKSRHLELCFKTICIGCCDAVRASFSNTVTDM